ncbi:competence protein ComJ [Candidatus Cyanaurora vandensis]|uniref:competence protein ComJ n=1 Tax=Candidatus Cyanaurora vandensis TaxID=2714958 RepID=UPI00257943E7|nr:competence protein ComJ [Candidatus Cyanaurora vandensis]
MSSSTKFSLAPCYGLVHVEEPGEVGTCFTDWTDHDIDQSFAWAPDGVSFCLLTDHSDLDVEVVIADSFTPLPEAVRIVQVPFEVVGPEGIWVSDLFGEGAVSVAPGQYALYFETGYTEPYDPDNLPIIIDTWCRLTFIASSDSQARILRADPPITVPLMLRAERVKDRSLPPWSYPLPASEP